MINHWISKNVGLSRILGEIQEDPLKNRAPLKTLIHQGINTLNLVTRLWLRWRHIFRNFRNSYVPKWGTPAKYGSKCSRHPFHCFISNHPWFSIFWVQVWVPIWQTWFIFLDNIIISYYTLQTEHTHTSTGRMGIPHVEADINSRGGKAIWDFATMYSLARAATAM